MGAQAIKAIQRRKRQMRVRRKIFGTPARPRLAVFRSLKHIYAQVVDDTQGRVLAAVSSLASDVRSQVPKGGGLKAAEAVGARIAQAALAKGVRQVAFDRRGYRYHGRVQTLADAARAGGLQF